MREILQSAPSMKVLLAWYFVAVWGAGYVATKIGLQYAPPSHFLTLRFAFGLLCLFPLVLLTGFHGNARGAQPTLPSPPS